MINSNFIEKAENFSYPLFPEKESEIETISNRFTAPKFRDSISTFFQYEEKQKSERLNLMKKIDNHKEKAWDTQKLCTNQLKQNSMISA